MKYRLTAAAVIRVFMALQSVGRVCDYRRSHCHFAQILVRALAGEKDQLMQMQLASAPCFATLAAVASWCACVAEGYLDSEASMHLNPHQDANLFTERLIDVMMQTKGKEGLVGYLPHLRSRLAISSKINSKPSQRYASRSR